MSDPLTSLSDFDGTARLFPLPNLVLFPHVIQPLHIFEPRYRELMADALAGDRLITMALLRPGWEEAYDQRPAIHPVVCLGRILQEEKLADGRYNLLLQGLSRARVVEELAPSRPYRLARVELLREATVPSKERDRELRGSLAGVIETSFAGQAAALSQMQKLVQGPLPLGALCDVLAFALPVPPEFKQQLLAELDAEERVRLLLTHLEASAQPQAGPSTTAPKWPPDFSAN